MTIDPRLLRSFVTLADELHFGRAAQHLHVAQPALSQQIRRLEVQLGTPLFARTRRRVELTEVGAAILPRAREAVAAAASVEEIGRGFARGERGRLRLGISPGAHYLAQALLSDFTEIQPHMRVRAHVDNSGVLAERIAARRLDLAVAFAAGPVEGVACERLVEEPAVLAVHAAHRLAGRPVVALAELAADTFALVDAHDGPGYNAAVLAACHAAGFEPRTPADPHGPMAWETAVRSGSCVGLTTRTAAPSTARGVRLVPVEPPVHFPIELLAPAEPGTPPAAAAAFAALARRRAAGAVAP